MSDTLSQLDRLTTGHGYAPGAEPSYWARFLDDAIGLHNAAYFYVLVCFATMALVGAMVRARLRRTEGERRRRLGRPIAAGGGAAAWPLDAGARAVGPRDDLASLRRARARQAKATTGRRV
ncbi:MAG: hypothetical protein AAGI51_16340 [Pseudomonadota bacterium]